MKGNFNLKTTLDRLYETYDFSQRVRHDPISIPMMYKNPADVEVAGFIAASLAYGRVDLFLPVLRRLLAAMGSSPRDFAASFDAKLDARRLDGISYRFQKPRDFTALMLSLRGVLGRHASLEAAFLSYMSKDAEHTGPGLDGLMGELLSEDTREAYGSDEKPQGLTFMFPHPANSGGASKRPNLFLRWMVRDRDIDFGIWRGVSKSALVIPLDTHIARISRCLGLTKRKANDYRTALEITRALKALDPEDPLKYDFALCHQGISGLCSPPGTCKGCGLNHAAPHGAPD